MYCYDLMDEISFQLLNLIGFLSTDIFSSTYWIKLFNICKVFFFYKLPFFFFLVRLIQVQKENDWIIKPNKANEIPKNHKTKEKPEQRSQCRNKTERRLSRQVQRSTQITCFTSINKMKRVFKKYLFALQQQIHFAACTLNSMRSYTWCKHNYNFRILQAKLFSLEKNWEPRKRNTRYVQYPINKTFLTK